MPSREEREGLMEALFLLGLVTPVRQDQIERKSKRLATIYHPDNARTGDSAEFQRVMAAKEKLLANLDYVNRFKIDLVLPTAGAIDESARLLDEVTALKQVSIGKDREIASLRRHLGNIAQRLLWAMRALACLGLVSLGFGGAVTYLALERHRSPVVPPRTHLGGSSVRLGTYDVQIRAQFDKITTEVGRGAEFPEFNLDEPEPTIQIVGSSPSGSGANSPNGQFTLEAGVTLGPTGELIFPPDGVIEVRFYETSIVIPPGEIKKLWESIQPKAEKNPEVKSIDKVTSGGR